MCRRTLIIGLALFFCGAVGAPLGADGTTGSADELSRVVEGREWIVGTWKSFKLDYGDFGEWKGAVQIELVASSPEEISLWLINSDGERDRAGDSVPCIMGKKTLFFGPIGSGLLFHYQRPYNDNVLTLELKTRSTTIHAKLRLVGQAPAEKP
jgi:hypothetical protein